MSEHYFGGFHSVFLSPVTREEKAYTVWCPLNRYHLFQLKEGPGFYFFFHQFHSILNLSVTLHFYTLVYKFQKLKLGGVV